MRTSGWFSLSRHFIVATATVMVAAGVTAGSWIAATPSGADSPGTFSGYPQVTIGQVNANFYCYTLEPVDDFNIFNPPNQPSQQPPATSASNQGQCNNPFLTSSYPDINFVGGINRNSDAAAESGPGSTFQNFGDYPLDATPLVRVR